MASVQMADADICSSYRKEIVDLNKKSRFIRGGKMKKVWFPILLAATAIAALSLITCSSPMLQEPAASQADARCLKVHRPVVLTGELHSGALYAIYSPGAWNGDLVLYAHGYVDPAAPIALPDYPGLPEFRAALMNLGYAVGYSSFSDNGWDLKDGAACTLKLLDIFTGKLGRPRHVFVIGHSMGALIALMLAEGDPGRISGVLPISGPIGGSSMEMNYVADVRMLFDFFYPGVLPGTAIHVPPGVDFNAVMANVLAAIQVNPAGIGTMALIDQIAVPYGSPQDLVQGVLGALYLQVVGTDDLIESAHDGVPFDNTRTDYTINGTSIPSINAGVARIAGDPKSIRYLKRVYQPNGRLRIPMLTMHDTGDGVVPLFHEIAYATAVAKNGRSNFLVQRFVNRGGHVNFTVEEQFTAFLDLVAWVKAGKKPLP
jgi:pimeloyl-ACP methyl ester carboxylesterase